MNTPEIDERQARILQYLLKEHYKNEIDGYCTAEGIASRMMTFELLNRFEKRNPPWVKRRTRGRFQLYQLSDTGAEELRRFRAFKEGKLTELVPVGPLEIKIKLGKDEAGGLLGEELGKKLNELFSDPKRAEELLRVFFSLSSAYASGLQGDDIRSNHGSFTSDGRFVHATLYGRKESLELRKLYSSGHFEKGREGAHVAELLSAIGLNGLMGQFQGHQRDNFIPHAIASFFILATDERGIFLHYPSKLEKDSLARIKESISRIEEL
ncbi:MAG: hypothetical protein ACLP9K_10045 [Nitrososphaerales archaeon]|jgi:hypothetical protein